VYVHQQRQQRRCGRAGSADLVQGSLEDLAGERGLAPGEVDCRKRARRVHVGVDLDAVEQLLGLLQTTLAHAQVGQPDQRADAQPGALTKSPQPHGLGQGGIGLGPASGRGQHPAVMGTAEGRDGGELASLGNRLPDPDPLICPGDVLRMLTSREELAEDLLQDAEVVDLAAQHRRERLVQQHHALFSAVAVDEAGPKIGQRYHLQVGVAEATSRLERRAEVLFPVHGSPSNMPRLSATHPASTESAASPSSVRARASQPLVTARSPTIVRYIPASVRATRIIPSWFPTPR
jgi:hypothetical protein